MNTSAETHPAGPAQRSPERPIRVLYVDHCALMSGGEIALLNLVSTIDRTRFTPIVLLCSEGPLVAALRAAEIETHVLPLDASVAETRKDAIGIGALSRIGAIFTSAAYIRRVAAFIHDHRIDIVHTNSLKADILGGFAARWARRPLIWHVRDRIADDYLPPLVARVFRTLCRIVPHVVIANSGSTLESIRLPRDKRSTVIYSGVKTKTRVRSVVHDGLNAGAFGEKTTDATTDVPRIGLLGRIAPWKGQDIFARAAAIVLKQFPDARFRVIGKVMFDEVEYEKRLHALVDELGIRSSFEFSGFRSDVAAALSELTMLVHASTTGEPFGQVIVEGMAAGLPVVATNGGGVPEIVLHGETGLLVPMKDVDAMAAAMIRLLSDPAAAKAMGQQGQRRARNVFSIDRTARAVEAIYDRLLDERA